MDLADFTRQRRLEQPYSKTSRKIGMASMLWALFLGPIYYWRQGALIEGLLFALAYVPLYFVDADSSAISPDILWDFMILAWIASVILAPVLLASSYRRRGWVEIPEGRTSSLDLSRCE
jgi:hypothetical protein